MSKNLYEIKLPNGTSLDNMVKVLEHERRIGNNVYCIFNSHKFYSSDITVDKAYLEIHGKTKKEYTDDLNKELEEMRKLLMNRRPKKEDINTIKNKLKMKGHRFIYPEKYSLWDKYVDDSFKSIYEGMDVKATLEILEALDEGYAYEDIEEIMYYQNHSSMSYSLVLCEVAVFSKDGPNFYVYMKGLENMDKAEIEALTSITNENKNYESNEKTRTK